MLMRAMLARLALHDGEVERHAVALLRRHGRLHARGVLAARDVLALELLLRALQRRAVEDARLGDADLPQRLLDRLGVEFLVADERQRADGRALLHGDDEHVALRLDAHVAEESGRVQRLDGLRHLLVVDALADLDRQVGEDRSGFGALHPFDADVAHGERIECPRRHATAAKRTTRRTVRARPGAAVAEERACRRCGAANGAGQNRRETSLNSARAMRTASMAMPMRWPTSKARSETGLPLKISAK